MQVVEQNCKSDTARFMKRNSSLVLESRMECSDPSGLCLFGPCLLQLGFILESQRLKAVRLKQDGDPFEGWQRQVQILHVFLCQSHGPRSTGAKRSAV